MTDCVASDVAGSNGSTGLRLLCPSPFHRDRVRDHFLPLIRRALTDALGAPIEVRLDLASTAARRGEDGSPGAARVAAPSPSPRIALPTPPTTDRVTVRAGSDLPALDVAAVDEEGCSSPSAASSAAPAPHPPRARREARSVSRPPSVRMRGARPASVGSPAGGGALGGRQPTRRPQQQSFDNFVVGPCNALAREASLAIARDRQLSLNQLYLNSAPGQGKTHLARSVVVEARRLAGSRVTYTSAEDFTNDFMSAIRSKDVGPFKRRYRKECDLLVVEDVAFFEGKSQTQLEFFHTVQHVLDAGGRVVLTGDRLPRRMRGLDPRLRDQFSSGFVAEIEAPDARVRREILRTKAASGGVHLPPDCVDLLVEQVHGSVRDLEGVLIQLVTTASLLKRSIDRDLTSEALAKKCGVPVHETKRPSPETVIRVVSTFFKTTPEALCSRSRRRDVLVPRQLAMYLCRRYTDASLTEIGRALGRDHPAVKNAVERVERDMLERAPLRYQVEALRERLDELAGRKNPAEDD